jgi:DNA-binding MarR family transcriptional regulator
MRAAEEIRYLVLAAQRDGNRQLAQALRPLGVTPSQAEVLRLLADRQPLSLTSLGELLVCESGTNPSRLVDRLVAANLVNRDTGSHDRRAIEVTLTPAGKRLVKRVTKIEEQMYRGIDEAGTGHDIEAVLSYLRTLVAGQPAGLAVSRRAHLSGGTRTEKELVDR